VETVKNTIKFFSSAGSPIILVFKTHPVLPKFLAKALAERQIHGIGKIRNFRPISRCIVETVKDRAVAME